MCKRLISKYMLRGVTLTAPRCSMNNPLIILFLFPLKVLPYSLSDLCKIHRGRPIFPPFMSVVKLDVSLVIQLFHIPNYSFRIYRVLPACAICAVRRGQPAGPAVMNNNALLQKVLVKSGPSSRTVDLLLIPTPHKGEVFHHVYPLGSHLDHPRVF